MDERFIFTCTGSLDSHAPNLLVRFNTPKAIKNDKLVESVESEDKDIYPEAFTTMYFDVGYSPDNYRTVAQLLDLVKFFTDPNSALGHLVGYSKDLWDLMASAFLSSDKITKARAFHNWLTKHEASIIPALAAYRADYNRKRIDYHTRWADSYDAVVKAWRENPITKPECACGNTIEREGMNVCSDCS